VKRVEKHKSETATMVAVDHCPEVMLYLVRVLDRPGRRELIYFAMTGSLVVTTPPSQIGIYAASPRRFVDLPYIVAGARSCIGTRCRKSCGAST
jgi:hypothetical protein